MTDIDHTKEVTDHIIRLVRGALHSLESAEEAATTIDAPSQLILHDLVRRARLALDLITNEEATRRNLEATGATND